MSATPLIRLSDLIVGRKCNQMVCPLELQVFNKTSCRCECLKTECVGYQILNQRTCDCECPKEKVASLCRHDNRVYDDSKCDCVSKTRKARQSPTGSAPPPPPPPPPPPSRMCQTTSRNCTNNLKVWNETSCDCECFQFKPANVTRELECPTPQPRTHTHTHTHRSRHNKPEPFDTNKYDYVYGEDGCPELTPKGKKYRKRKISPGRGKRKTKSKGRKKKGEKTPTKPKPTKEPPTTDAPDVDGPAIRAPVDSCPIGQMANTDTCECVEM